MASKSNKILILGIGNVLMGDEGIGVHCVQSIDHSKIPAGIDIVDGGTGGFHMLEYLSDYDTIIMIDATMDAKVPGSISLLEPHFAHDFPRTLSSHDIGLRDLLESASLLGDLPKIYLFTITVANLQVMHMELSEQLNSVVEKVQEKIYSLAALLKR